MNILFTCAGRRNYLLQFFKEELGAAGCIMAADMQQSAPAMATADKAFVVPAIYTDGYVDFIISICIREKVDAVISLNDLELPILAARSESFKEIGTKLLISSIDVIDICFDKLKTIEFAKKLGIDTPVTFTNLNSAKEALQDGRLKFPLVVKPRWGSASIGLEFPSDMRELELAFELISIRLNRTILNEVSSSDFDNAILIQENINGVEYGVDILNNFKGMPCKVYVKEKLAMRSGETDKSVLREKPEIQQIAITIGESLGHFGNLDCDLFEVDDVIFLLEMNPRFGGGYPFTHNAGGNYVAAILAWIREERYDFSTFHEDFDQIFSKCDSLIKVNGN